jgi:hypothetical protein
MYEIIEFVGTIKRGGIEDYMVVCMRPVYVRSHDKSVVAFRERQGEPPPYLIGILGADFPRLEALPDVISEYVAPSLISPCDMLVFSFGKYELSVGDAGIALKRSDEPSSVRFAMTFDIIYDGGDH